jgi:hypothetical protein
VLAYIRCNGSGMMLEIVSPSSNCPIERVYQNKQEQLSQCNYDIYTSGK